MKRYIIVIASVVLILVVMTVRPVSALAFTVKSTADEGDVIPGDGVCETFAPGKCTLQAAIM